MYLSYQNGKIIGYTEEPQDLFLYNLDKVEETNEEYVLSDDGTEYVLKNEAWLQRQFEERKKQLHTENLEAAYQAEENGEVEFNGAHFETTASNISKLTSQFAMIQSGVLDSVQWLSKDDIVVVLNAEDIMTLGQLMAAYTSDIWNNKYLEYKSQIENAKTIEDLAKISLLY